MALQLTPNQEAVVNNRGGGLLVSAAAGSGKTRVLVERLLDRVLTEKRDIHEFLIITFTRAAAEELRGRISKELHDRVRKDPENRHLRRQVALLYRTQISTIHAFCTLLLREWGHLLELAPDFTLCESEEAVLLMTKALQEVLEERYESIDPEGDFAKLLDILAAGRDDRPLMEIVLDIYGRMQSHPDPARWMEEQLTLLALEQVSEAGETLWGRMLLEDTRDIADYWARRLSEAVELTLEDAALAPYTESLQATVDGLQELICAAEAGWDQAARAIDIPFPRLKPIRSCEDPQRKEDIQELRKQCKGAVDTLATRFESSSAGLLRDLGLLRPAMTGLFDLVREFDRRFQQMKRRKSILDFSDLEHKAVALLTDETGAPTAVAGIVGSRFLEIMVDEYQDTNQVQNTIFYAISQEGRNLFLVGDVKQSIYRFRLADPTIFLEKYRRFLPFDTAAQGEERKILLSQNFRSRPQVLEAVNDLFRAVMSRRLGEMDYTEEEALYPGGSFPQGAGYETELHVLDFKTPEEEGEEKSGSQKLEARYIAGEIARLLTEGPPVSDGAGGTRPIEPEDIAILLRSPGTVRHHYVAALQGAGIPCSTEEGEDAFSTTEVSVIYSFLQIIDNPRQDVPLISVLHSPLYGFDGERLARIRTMAEGDFYTALVAAGAAGMEDAKAFLEELALLRFGAGELSSHGLLWRLYQQTNALEIFGRMPGGRQREQNLLAFYELASRFESSGHKGLFPFLFHLSNLREAGGGLLSRQSREQRGVKLLSIHRSKGLEYPVVILAGLGKRFNYGDIQKPVLFHSKLGLGPRGVDSSQMVEFQTLPRMAVSLQLKREMMAEEMRLLYVAMTRAKEKLLMVCTLPHGEGELKRLSSGVTLPVDPQQLERCSSVGQWVLLAAMARPEAEVLRKITGRAPPAPGMPLGPDWKIVYHRGIPPERKALSLPEEEIEVRQGLFQREELWETLHWRYPYEALAATPAKITATQLPDTSLTANTDRESYDAGEASPFHRPRFATESFGLTAAQRGTAYHTILQSIALERCETLESVQEEISRLVGQRFLTEEEAMGVDPKVLYRFFASELGRELRAIRSLHREYPFSILVSAAEFYPGAPAEEQILLQGVVDCWFETEEGITLVDFKTNQITAEAAREKAEDYRMQMTAYARALEEITGIPVRRRVIWFLHPNLGIGMP